MRCPNCQRQNLATNKFCVGCGTPLSYVGEPKDSQCAECFAPLATDAAFCVRCGTRVAAPPASAAAMGSASVAAAAMAPPSESTSATQATGSGSAPDGAAVNARNAGRVLVEGLGKAERDPTGVLAGVAIFVTSALASWLLWYPLSWPSRWLSGLIPPVDCTTMAPASLSMSVCVRIPAALSVISTLILVTILYRLRHKIMNMVHALSARLPREVRFLTVPLAASLAFAFAWSGMHWAFPGQLGLLPQNLFPATVGLLSYVVIRYGNGMKRRLDGLFAWRDRLKTWQRVALVIASPMVISLLIPAPSFLSRPALGEQVAWLSLLCVGYLVITPRNRQTEAADGNRA